MAVRRQTSNKQILYLELYNAGFSMGEIADHFGVGRSTISRTLKRARRLTCPFTPNCEKCPLSECAFKPEYASLINNPEKADRNRNKGEPVEEALKKILEQREVQEEPAEKFVYQTPISEKVDISQKKEEIEPASESEVEKPRRKRGRPKKSDIAISKEESTVKSQEPPPPILQRRIKKQWSCRNLSLPIDHGNILHRNGNKRSPMMRKSSVYLQRPVIQRQSRNQNQLFLHRNRTVLNRGILPSHLLTGH